MEDAHKSHKESAFGWGLWVRELSSALADARLERDTAALRDRKTPVDVMSLPGGLQNLAAPH